MGLTCLAYSGILNYVEKCKEIDINLNWTLDILLMCLTNLNLSW